MTDDVERILQWPRETRSRQEEHVLLEHLTVVHAEIRALVDGAERLDRDLTAEEAVRYAQLQGEFDRLRSEVPSAR
jgi:hypothetical protein